MVEERNPSKQSASPKDEGEDIDAKDVAQATVEGVGSEETSEEE